MDTDFAMLTEAIKIADRSPMIRFRTGAVIAYDDTVLSRGWSHKSDLTMTKYFSIHAELHALIRQHAVIPGSTIYIAAINRQGNTVNARPCSDCVALLYDERIRRVVYTTTPYVRHGKEVAYRLIKLNNELDYKTFKQYKRPEEYRSDTGR